MILNDFVETRTSRQRSGKAEHRRILQIIVDADFANSALFIFTRAKHVLHTVQGQRMWNVAFVTISPTHTKLHNNMH